MSKYILFPVVMTDVVCGYSAMGIEMTEANMKEMERLRNIFVSTVSFEKSITEIVFGNPMFEIEFFNEDFQHDDTLKIEDLSYDDVITYTNPPVDEYSETDAPEIVITADYFTIKANSKHGIGELYSNVLYSDLLSLLLEDTKEKLGKL